MMKMYAGTNHYEGLTMTAWTRTAQTAGTRTVEVNTDHEMGALLVEMPDMAARAWADVLRDLPNLATASDEVVEAFNAGCSWARLV